MANKPGKIDRVPQQMSLLDCLERIQAEKRASRDPEGSLNINVALRRAMKRAIKQCHLSRHQIAGEMSHLVGVEITKTMIDSWTAESKPQNRPPAEYIPAFCRATGSNEPLEVLTDAAGIFAMPGPDALRAEIQRFAEEERRARAEKRKRELFLQEIESKRRLI